MRTRTYGTATFGEFTRSGDQLDAFCEACRHLEALDMAALADRFGLDGIVRDCLIGRLVCKKCGSRDVGFRRTPHSKEYRP